MIEMEITYIFIKYISVTIQRQATAFYRRHNRITFNENIEFIEDFETDQKIVNQYSEFSNILNKNFDEKFLCQELLMNGLESLSEIERYIIYEKYLNQRSDLDIGREFSISSQMVSKKKRKIIDKLKKHFFSN